MKQITKNEARYIVLRYLCAWAGEATKPDADFYTEIPEHWILDKTKLEKMGEDLIHKSDKAYYPNATDTKIIIKEMNSVWRALAKQSEKCLKNFIKSLDD